MSENQPSKEQELADQINNLVEQLTASQSEALKDARALQLAGQALLQREELRLARKLGKDHPRLQQLRERRATMLGNIHRLGLEKQAADIRVPPLKEKEALIQGRVLDEQGRGIQGQQVLLVDDKGEVVIPVQATTDTSGYYALRVDPAILPADRPLRLAIRTPQKQEIYRADQAISLKEGEQLIREVKLKRVEISGVSQRPSKTGAEKPWEVSGTVTGPQGQMLPDLKVSVFAKEKGMDVALGVSVTDRQGRYRISSSKQPAFEGLRSGAELILTVSDKEGRTVFTSRKGLRYEPGHRVDFDIQIKLVRRK